MICLTKIMKLLQIYIMLLYLLQEIHNDS